MKNILALAVALILATAAFSQAGSAFFKAWSDTNDTLGLNTTKTYDFNTLVFPLNNGSAQNITDTWSYSITIEADSLSGANSDSSTIFLQVSNSPLSDSNPIWVSLETGQINGTATQTFHYTGDIEEPRIRLLIYSKSGAKAIALRSYAAFKRKYKTR